ncbi:Gfo/Idh/MocA family oxidoreductase [Candidatus Pelagibacter bacterium]|nr:Gfo/Idh/MocA family oxidoreductase [Candidatus Pelagibacter bacterium]
MVNVALLGFGRIGQMHAQNINQNKSLKLLYVYEKIDKLSKKAKKLYNCSIEKNYKKIFLDKKVDIVFISSPTNTHIKFIEEGIKYKKTIFCEKPLDLNIQKIIKTFKKVKINNSKIQLGFNRRFDPGHHSIKKDLDNGKIGRLEKVIITSRDPAPPSKSYLKSSGGIFRDMMIHDFDLCRYYLKNDEISEISASTSSFENFYKKINDHELAAVTMKSKSGVICVVTNSRHCSFGYDQRVELFGKKGMLLSGNLKNNATEVFDSNQSHSQKPFLNFFIERYKEAYNLQLNELVLLHKNKIKPRSTFEDGYLALKIANAAYHSLKQKRLIKIK